MKTLKVFALIPSYGSLNIQYNPEVYTAKTLPDRSPQASLPCL